MDQFAVSATRPGRLPDAAFLEGWEGAVDHVDELQVRIHLQADREWPKSDVYLLALTANRHTSEILP